MTQPAYLEDPANCPYPGPHPFFWLPKESVITSTTVEVDHTLVVLLCVCLLVPSSFICSAIMGRAFLTLLQRWPDAAVNIILVLEFLLLAGLGLVAVLAGLSEVGQEDIHHYFEGMKYILLEVICILIYYCTRHSATIHEALGLLHPSFYICNYDNPTTADQKGLSYIFLGIAFLIAIMAYVNKESLCLGSQLLGESRPPVP